MSYISYEKFKEFMDSQAPFSALFPSQKENEDFILRFLQETLNKTRNFVLNFNDDDYEMLSEGMVYQMVNLANLNRMLTVNGTQEIHFTEHRTFIEKELKLLEGLFEQVVDSGEGLELYQNDEGKVSMDKMKGFKKVPSENFYNIYGQFLNRIYTQITNNEPVTKKITTTYMDIQFFAI